MRTFSEEPSGGANCRSDFAQAWLTPREQKRTKNRHGDAIPKGGITIPTLLDPRVFSRGQVLRQLGFWRNARMLLPVTPDEGLGLRVIRLQVHTRGISPKVVDAARASFHDRRIRPCSRVDRSCIYWNCRTTRHAHKANSHRPNRCQNDTHRVSSFGDSVHPLENALFLVTV
jgi:hypothetical protein